MNWFAFFPGLYKDPNVGGDKIGFFVNPRRRQQFTQLGGQGISVVSYSDHKDDALEYVKWFAQPDCATEMVGDRRLFGVRIRGRRPRLSRRALLSRRHS